LPKMKEDEGGNNNVQGKAQLRTSRRECRGDWQGKRRSVKCCGPLQRGKDGRYRQATKNATIKNTAGTVTGETCQGAALTSSKPKTHTRLNKIYRQDTRPASLRSFRHGTKAARALSSFSSLARDGPPGAFYFARAWVWHLTRATLFEVFLPPGRGRPG